MKSLTAILSVAIILLFCAADLSAQEKEDDKRLEITGYFGAGGRAREGQFRSYSTTHFVGLGLEYYLSPRIALEGEINYLPNIASVSGGAPWGRSDLIITKDEKYRLLWGINLLFYFDRPKIIKRPAIRLYLSAGTGYQYDRVEFNVVSLTTLEQYKYGYAEFAFQWISIGAGLKVNIIDGLAVRLLYKINRFGGEGLQTNRLALGLSYRF